MDREVILEKLEGQKPKTRTRHWLYEQLSSYSKQEIDQGILELMNMHELFDEQDHFSTRQQKGYILGQVSMTPKGSTFVQHPTLGKLRVYSQDIIFPKDVILYEFVSQDQSAKHILTLQHQFPSFVGTVKWRKGNLRCVLDDERFYLYPYHISNPKKISLYEGMKVKLTLTNDSSPLQFSIEEKIGDASDVGMDVLEKLIALDVRIAFPKEVSDQVETIAQVVSEEDKKGRTSLLSDLTITIDGDDSKDFDDALSIEKVEDGYILKVSIADVAHYVQEGTPLDQEAFLRGCSIYVVDRVVPMLPHELSNGICSLNPKVIRLTQTCQMHVSFQGEILSYQIYPSYIRSFKRMTYRQVNQILEGDPKALKEHEILVELITNLQQCTRAIRKRRQNQGAMEFETRESKIKLDETGFPIAIEPRIRKEAEMLVEDCMIAANVCVANYLRWQEIPAIYRIHEQPSAKKIKEFQNVASLLGKPLRAIQGEYHAKLLQQYLSSIEKSPLYPVLSTLLLRSMAKARYDTNCLGHFGLAEDEYLHFTSPIRRYPDLIVHRMLHRYCYQQNMDLQQRQTDLLKNQEAANMASDQERQAMDAEYAIDDMKKAEYMQVHIGEKFDGIISGVTSFGFFVELENTIEGLVHISTLKGQYYRYDEGQMALVGTHNGKRYTFGQKVKIKVINADKGKGIIDFEIVEKRRKLNHETKSKRKNRRK